MPESFERVRIYAAPRANERVRARVKCHNTATGGMVFEVLLTGAQGRLLEHIEGLSFRRTNIAAAAVTQPSLMPTRDLADAMELGSTA